MRRITFLFFLTGAAAVSACGSSIVGETAAGTTGAGGETSTGGAGGGEAVGFGNVTLSTDQAATLFFGTFYLNPGGTGGGCQMQTFGACIVYDCGGGGGPTIPDVSAGTLSVRTGALSLSAMPGSDDLYLTNGPGAQPWSEVGGEDVEFQGTGAVAPAFDVHVDSPGVPSVSEPAFPADPTATMMIPTSQDLVVTWSGGALDANVIVGLDANATDTMFTSCSALASAGQITVPSAALAWLKGMPGSIGVNAATSSSPTIDGWQIFATALSQAVTPQGQDASSLSVQFE